MVAVKLAYILPSSGSLTLREEERHHGAFATTERAPDGDK
jgi:hypothetical protein